MRFYKALLKAVPIAVLTVVLPRVASFTYHLGAQGIVHWVISSAFAILLGLGVIGTSYFSDFAEIPEYDEEVSPRSKEGKRREKELAYYTAMMQAAPYAQRAMYVFAVLDGVFNLADALIGADANGLFAAQNQFLSGVYYGATVIYGISPTILSILLSRLASMIDRIPDGYEKAHRDEIDWIRTIMGNLGWREFKAEDDEAESVSVSVSVSGNETETESRRRPGVSKKDLVWRYLDTYATPETMPTIDDIKQAIREDAGVNVSTGSISEARSQWLENNS
jgi:hypothetical protein